MEQDINVVLLIGRVEGKVDTLVHMFGATAQRLDAMELRLAEVEQQIAAASASDNSTKTWVVNVIALLAVAAAFLSPIIEKVMELL